MDVVYVVVKSEHSNITMNPTERTQEMKILASLGQKKQ